MRIKIILFIFTLGLITSAQSQNKHGIAKYGIFVDVNSGIQQSGNFDFKSNNSPGQNLLGLVIKEGTFSESFFGTGEIGLESSILLKNRLLLSGKYNMANSLFNSDSRLEDIYIRGTWKGRGCAMGIGYGVLTNEDEKPFLFRMSISLGSYKSHWKFSNQDINSVNFGNVKIKPSSSESFFSNNYYLDFNLNVADIKFLRKQTAKSCINTGLSLGYRQSINAGNWIWENNNEVVQNINRTVMMGFYFKISVGLGYISKYE